jgi:serine/threonine kinase PknH
MSIHPNPLPTAHNAPPPNWGERTVADRGATHPGPRSSQPNSWAPMWARPTGAAPDNSGDVTQVLARRIPPAATYPPAPALPPPGMEGWPRAAYPPPARPRGTRARTWAWIGGATAAVVAAIVCAGLIATETRSATTPAYPPASPPPHVPTAVIEPTEAPPAPTVPLDALSGLLLDVGTVNTIEHATDIRLLSDPSDSAFVELSSDRPECEGIQHPAMTEALRASGYLGAQTQSLRDDNHIVAQAVIDYPSAAAATTFAAKQAQNWTKCNGKPITLTTPADGSVTFTVGAVTNRDGMLTVLFTQEGARGWACQRALTTRNNIVVDTRSCGFNRTDQAITAAARMADRVSTH